jgi:hypothetical protein
MHYFPKFASNFLPAHNVLMELQCKLNISIMEKDGEISCVWGGRGKGEREKETERDRDSRCGSFKIKICHFPSNCLQQIIIHLLFKHCHLCIGCLLKVSISSYTKYSRHS